MFSVVIVNWNSKDYVRQSINSVLSTCSELSPQIVVVDGGSFDGCGEMILSEFSGVEFVQSPENVGFGRSNNLGFARVRNDVVLLLNPDAELKPGAAKNLFSELHRLPDVGVLGARLLNSDGSLQKSCVQSLPNPWNQALDSELLRRVWPKSRLWGSGNAFASSVSVKVEAISGACMLMRSETFRRIGGFSPEYFMYGEDMDLCARIRHLGLNVYYVPTAEVVHHGGGSSRRVSTSSSVWMRRSVYHFILTHHGQSSAVAYRMLMGISSLVRLSLLAPACILTQSAQRAARLKSFQKWVAILRWCAGFENAAATRG